MESIKALSSPSVILKNVQAQGNKLITNIEVSPEIARFFLEDTFFAEYNVNLENIPESILSIPALSTILTVAWAVGADVYIDEIDETYLHAMTKVKEQLKQWYPQLSFSTTIRAEKVVGNQFNNRGHGLLFSGGVDSLFSCARHRDKHPTLISICGGDIPYYADRFWAKVENWLLNFASDEKLAIQFIKANMREVINRKYLESKFGIDTWWGSICHGLMLLSLCAPLTNEQIGTITIAATHTCDFNHPWGSHPLLDPRVSWSDVEIVHDGYDFSRQKKLRYLINECPTYLKYLRVCYLQHLSYNCGHCEKCLRTITGLLLENKDLRDCNFKTDKNILHLVKDCFSRRVLSLGESERFSWKDIQNNIPPQLQDGDYGQKNFFAWFKEVDLTNYRKSRLAALMYLGTYFFRHKNLSDMARHASRKIKQLWKALSTTSKRLNKK